MAMGDAWFLLGRPCCNLTVNSLPAQVVDIPEALVEDHDLTVDYILTPTRVITTGCARPKPTGIMWSKVGHHTADVAQCRSVSRGVPCVSWPLPTSLCGWILAATLNGVA
jgi:hypothetical protein